MIDRDRFRRYYSLDPLQRVAHPVDFTPLPLHYLLEPLTTARNIPAPIDGPSPQSPETTHLLCV